MNGTPLKCAAPAVLLAALVLLPFADNAFTIDDTLFMEQATHALGDPLHPTAFETVWSEAAYPKRMSQIMPSGAVAAWALVPAALAGGSERIAHLTQLIAFAVAILSTVSIALRLGLDARLATIAGLLLAATPAALAMAGTAMPDVVAMALGVAGIERLLAWRVERRVHQAAAAAVLLGLAPLARTHLLLVVGVGFFLLGADLLAERRLSTESWALWSPLGAAPAITAVIMWVTRDPAPGGGDLASSAQSFTALKYGATNTVAFLTHWVTVLPLGVAWVVLRFRALARRWWVPLVGAAASAAALVWESGGNVFPTCLLAAVGAAVLVDVLADALQPLDRVQVGLWGWLLVPLPIAVYLHMPPKYLLAAAPAAALLVARRMARSAPQLAVWLTGSLVVVGVVLGVAILRANGAFASVGKRTAAEVIAPRVAAGERVWFAGSWGFKWYAERAGGRPLTLTPPFPEPGDLLVIARRSMARNDVIKMAQVRYPRSVMLARLEEKSPGGRTMSAAAGAGFFSNGWGYLPWAWGDDLIDGCDVWRVQ